MVQTSPYLLLQEIYREHPWRMLVCCIMLNCTSRKQVDRVRDEFFRLWPTADSVKDSDEEKMVELISTLGFKDRRSKTIIRFSREFIQTDWTEPSELHGIGKYGQDSWEIFQKYNFNVLPTDSVLVTYLNWIKQTQNHEN
jgi:methyl-CpG-binding domain protein 4